MTEPRPATYPADDLAEEIERVLGLPVESVGTRGQEYIQLTLAQARALLDFAEGKNR